jgi:hypothetical protein
MTLPSDSPYPGLRSLVLTSDPAALGIRPSDRYPSVIGLLTEFGAAGGSATLVSLADGTASLYTSGGGGIIGAGFNERVAQPTLRLLDAVQASLDLVPPATDTPLPSEGQVAFVVRTHEGLRRAEASSGELARGHHPLSPIFYAANEVLTQLRLLDDEQQKRRGS